MNWIRNKITNWIQMMVIRNIRIGGWCGLCGGWIPDELFPSDWPYGACISCRTITSDSSSIEVDTR